MNKIRPGYVLMGLFLLVALPLSVYETTQQTNTQQHAEVPAKPLLGPGGTQQITSEPQSITATPTPENPTPTHVIDFLP